MHRYIIIFYFSIAAFSLQLNSQDSAKHHQPLASYQGLLWEITGNGLSEPSYLYGALETTQKLAYHLIDSFFVALYNVDKIVLEIHPDSMRNALRDPAVLKRIYKHSFGLGYRPGYDYYSILEPREFNADMFEYILGGFGSQMAGMRQQQRGADLEEENTLPDFVYISALKLNKDIAGIISYSEQLDLSEKAEKLMREEQKNPKNIREDYSEFVLLYQKAFEAYRKGDLGMLDSLYRRIINSEVMYSDIINSLTELYAERVAEQLADASILAVIDAIYLAGENGIIEHLRKQGFELRPVKHYILTKPNKQKEKLEKMTRKIKLGQYNSITGFWEIKVPDYTIVTVDERAQRTYFTDNLNGTVYNVNRYPTHAQLAFQSPDYLFERMDSILYEYVPGKIVRRKDFLVDGYPGVEITNRTSRGNLEQFKLVITPLEIIVFRISGQKNYIRKKGLGRKVMKSATIHMPDQQTWNSVTTGHGEFSLSLPSYHIVDTAKSQIYIDPEIEYQAWDPVSSSYFLFRRNVHHDLRYLEEDTFDLNFMAEKIAENMNKEIRLNPPSTFMEFPSVTFDLWSKGKEDTLNGKIIMRGASHYLLMTSTKEPLLTDRFFAGFKFLPFDYTLQRDTIIDSTLVYSVVSDIYKQETDDDDEQDDYFFWMEEDDDEEDDSYESKRLLATYYFDLGSEYIEVERFKEHDYKQYLSYQELWKSLTAKASNDSDLIITSAISDTTLKFPFLHLVLSDTNTIRQIHKRFIIYHGVIYSLSSMSNIIEGMPEFTSTFFESFTPLDDTLIGRSLFEDNGMLFIRNFISEDTGLVKQAINSLHLVNFTQQHRDSLYYVISNTELMKRNFTTAAKLIIEFGKIKSERYSNELELLYELYAGNPSLQMAVFNSMANQQHPEAKRAMLRIMNKDLPLPHNKESVSTLTRPLLKTIDQLLIMFPDLMRYERYPEYSKLVYTLLAELTGQNKFNIDRHPEIANTLKINIEQDLKRRLARDQADKAATEMLEDIYSPFYDIEEDLPGLSDDMEGDFWELVEEEMDFDDDDEYQEIVYSDLVLMIKALSGSKRHNEWLHSKIYDQVFAGRNKNDALAIAVHGLKTGFTAPDSIWSNFAANPKIRIDLYRKLLQAGALNHFDTAWMNQNAFVESFIHIKARLDDKDSLTFLQRRFVNTPRKSGFVYFYKYKIGYGNDRNWVIGIVGIQPADSSAVSAKPDFVELNVERIYVDDDISEIIDKEMRDMRKLYRKRFSALDEDLFEQGLMWGFDF